MSANDGSSDGFLRRPASERLSPTEETETQPCLNLQGGEALRAKTHGQRCCHCRRAQGDMEPRHPP